MVQIMYFLTGCICGFMSCMIVVGTLLEKKEADRGARNRPLQASLPPGRLH